MCNSPVEPNTESILSVKCDPATLLGIEMFPSWFYIRIPLL